jgi:hypothetical protein
MTKYRHRLILMMLAVALSILFMGQTSIRWKAMIFDNPGSKRLLKSEKSSIYYYRPLPEKSMILNVQNMQAIEIRAIAKSKTDKPQFVLKYNDKKTVYDLKFFSASVAYQVFEPVRITLMPGVKQVELVCYNRNIYFRAFQPITIQKKKTFVPALKILKNSGSIDLTNNAVKKQYYTFKEKAPFTFQINQGKAFSLYVRAQLTEKKAPVFGIYKNGELVDKVSLSVKRTKTYTAEGITHLTIGRKFDYPAQDKIAVYELRALTDNLFIAKPVIRKAK